MPYDRSPGWRYFPQSDAPPPPLAEVAAAFRKMGPWFKKSFWPSIDDDGERMNTKKTITPRLENYLKPDAQQLQAEDGLVVGWNVETREKYPKIPLLYGENDMVRDVIE